MLCSTLLVVTALVNGGSTGEGSSASEGDWRAVPVRGVDSGLIADIAILPNKRFGDQRLVCCILPFY